MIGLAAAAHLAATVFGWSFGRCAMVFAGLAGAVLAGCGAGLLVYRMRSEKRFFRREDGTSVRQACFESPAEGWMYAVFGVMVLSQFVFICTGDTNYRQGDMTVETVGSFLATDALYQVNPMTGLPYTQGIPSRLKILCLPTLYASLSKLTGLSPMTVVWKVIPAVTLVSSYTAFTLLSFSLFPKTEEGTYRKKRACFMTIVSLLIWVGAYQAGMDGFQLLCGGWMGVTIRNLVFLPWLLSLCLRKRWLLAALCIPAEACIVWTLYGCGVCMPFLLGMGILQHCFRETGTAAMRRK